MKKVIYILSVAFLAQSCFSGAGTGALTGTMTGGMLGGAVGGLFGGPHGRDMGTVIGFLAGAATGAAVGAAQEERYNEYVDSYNSDNYRRQSRSNIRRQNSTSSSNDDMYGRVQSYNRGTTQNTMQGSSQSDTQYNTQDETTYSFEAAADSAKAACPLKLRKLRFIDEGGNQTINREENCKIIFELANPTTDTIKSVVPYIYEVNGNEHLTLSPSTRIEAIKGGDAVRYTCSMRSDNKLAEGTAKFRISVSIADGDFVTLREFALPTSKTTYKPSEEKQ